MGERGRASDARISRDVDELRVGSEQIRAYTSERISSGLKRLRAYIFQDIGNILRDVAHPVHGLCK